MNISPASLMPLAERNRKETREARMKPSLETQIQQAQAAYDASHERHPRSAWTDVLWRKLRDLKMRQLKKEMVHRTREPASAPIGHQEAECVSA